MQLSTEERGEIDDVTAAQLAAILDEDAFGSFVILAESDRGFIQAANNWSPGDACEAFIARHRSDPWILEYRDAASAKHFQVSRDVTLDEVKRAFLEYLRGAPGWRSGFQWSQIDV